MSRLHSRPAWRGVNFFDTAAMYSGGGSERRLGELARGKSVVVATKFPPGPMAVPTAYRPRWRRVLIGYGVIRSTCTSTTFRRGGSTFPG